MGGSSGGGSRIGHAVPAAQWRQNMSAEEGFEAVRINSALKAPEGRRQGGMHAEVQNGWLTVGVSYLNRSERGRGYGMGVYIGALKEAKRRGIGFRSDASVSPQAQKVWDKLKARGLNVVSDGKRMSVSSAELEKWGGRDRPWTGLERPPGQGREGSQSRYRRGWK